MRRRAAGGVSRGLRLPLRTRRSARLSRGGHSAAGAYTWLHAAETAGGDADVQARKAEAGGFFRTAGAVRFLSDVRLMEALDRPA